MTELICCKRCHATLTAEDNYCRNCGRSLKPGHGFWYSHSGIILLALVLGPFALPCVWMSKRISKTAQFIYSAVLLLIGYYFILVCYHIFQLVQEATQLVLSGGF